ncbi:MAG TPA: hypothetical protein VF174_00755 [Micromonosporaceae bacterium]
MEIYIDSMSVAPRTVLASAAQVVLAPNALARPQAHPAPAQAERVRLAASELTGTTGFAGMGIRTSNKRTDVRGVPPRGEPV